MTLPAGWSQILTDVAGTGSMRMPEDFNPLNNYVECVGGGGSNYPGGFGGGGGAYAKTSNIAVYPGRAVAYHVGGISEGTYFNGASYGASSVAAAAGTTATFGVTGVGGDANACIGDVAYSGGSAVAAYVGGFPGGGGAAGWSGAGANSVTTTGGASGGYPGGAGGNGAIVGGGGVPGYPYGGGAGSDNRLLSGATGVIIISYLPLSPGAHLIGFP